MKKYCTIPFDSVLKNVVQSSGNTLTLTKVQNLPGPRCGQKGCKKNHYVESSCGNETQMVSRAMEYHISGDQGEVVVWLQNRGFTKHIATKAYEVAMIEEGDASSLWNIVQGLSAFARQMYHVDTRLDLERQTGRLLDIVH